MKRLIGFVFLLIGSIGYGQTFDSTKLIKNELYGQKHKRWQVDSQMIIPKTGDTLVKAPGQIKILSNTFMYTGQDRHWHIAGAGPTGTTSDTYTRTQVDSAIAANKLRFGIEDITSDVDRSVDMGQNNLEIYNAHRISLFAENGPNGSYGFHSLYQGRSVISTADGLGHNTDFNIIGDSINFAYRGGVVVFPKIAENSHQVLVVSVNGNFADSTGNIDLGTIGGTAGVSSFNSRSGAVVSQFTDYSAYYQPLGRYIDSLRRVGTTVSGLINGAWIPQYTDSVGGGGITTETDPLSVHITDSATMLSPYLRSANAAVLYQPAGSYATTSQLALKVNISDTSSMLSPYLRSSTASATYQPIGSYLTGNQTITLSGDVSGSGSTAITTTLASVVTAATVGSSTQIPVITYDAKGRITSTTTAAVSAGAGTVTGGSITWPGAIYSTPTTGTVSSGTLTFAPSLANQSAYTVLGRANSTGTPSFISSLDSNWIPSLHTQAYYDARYAAIGTGGSGTLTGWSTTGNSGTTWTTNFAGTTDNISYRIRTNNIQRALYDSIGNFYFASNSNQNGNGSTSPLKFSLGDTYGTNTNGSMSNIKLRVYDGGTINMGIGLGPNGIMEYQVYNGYSHGFYVFGTKYLGVTSSGINVTNDLLMNTGNSYLTWGNAAGVGGVKLFDGGGSTSRVGMYYMNSGTPFNGGMLFSAYSGSITGANIVFASGVDPSTATIANSTMILFNTKNVGIGGAVDVSNRKFNVASTTGTSHPFPSMTLAQRTAITMTSSNYGDHVYQTDGTEGVYVYKSTGWTFAY